jgi:hypothetical protein
MFILLTLKHAQIVVLALMFARLKLSAQLNEKYFFFEAPVWGFFVS